ncbi:hypothetical protein M407DRAFT_9858 [Tulasnella calospora MUT 4182]|uniref:Uncharacterized protein n=1 Tax=Tulasnella calospora MUT 4182 TaxID=1051891 RepID=A0A0C3QD10_9AGAM|nr:hypothetical protein M407DRAFT_9858 [Tulasnella calospora MUT 4182]
MSATSAQAHSGLSVLVNNVFDLNPDVNLLPGAMVFYSAYPAAEGKVGIYTKWAGEHGAQGAVKGVRNGVAPRSSTWSQAVNTLHKRYTELNPLGFDITSVLVVPDKDDDSDASASLGDGNGGEGALGSVGDLLDSLPTHILEAARHRRPPLVGAISIHSATPSKTSLADAITTPSHGLGDTGGLAQFSTPVKLKQSSAKPNTMSKSLDTTASRMSSGTAPPSHRPHTSKNSIPPNASTSSTLIDSPVRGVGISQFMAPSPEVYALGHWTETILEFIQCREVVIPIIKTHLLDFSHDEDDIGFQAVLSEVFTVELSHLVVKLLKLDAFLKTVGEKQSKQADATQKKTYKLSTQEQRERKKAKEAKLDALFADVKKVFRDKEDAVTELATKYDVPEHTVRGFIGEAKTTSSRAINPKNAYAHWRLQELNKDLPKGERLTLKDYYRDHGKEYEAAEDATIQLAIESLQKQRESKRMPVRKKGRAALRDVNTTMAKMATMADQLALRTDHQVMILASKTSHQSYAAPMAHVTPTAEGFTDTLFKTDMYAAAHHFEAYGTEGSQGVAHSSRTAHSRMKRDFVAAMHKSLHTASDRRDAILSYEHFHHKVVLRYHVDIVGWPNDIPFKNTSELTRAHLKRLYSLATSVPPALHFVALDQEELNQRIAKRTEDEANGLVEPWTGNKKKGAQSTPETAASAS